MIIKAHTHAAQMTCVTKFNKIQRHRFVATKQEIHNSREQHRDTDYVARAIRAEKNLQCNAHVNNLPANTQASWRPGHLFQLQLCNKNKQVSLCTVSTQLTNDKCWPPQHEHEWWTLHNENATQMAHACSCECSSHTVTRTQ